MSKNILIFSDGTGQRGGVNFDEVRTNVYKIYRASRIGPDGLVDPIKQVAFYDPGLGSAPVGDDIIAGLWVRLKNLVAQATGLGITNNITDCYASLIKLWEPGDRIFLIGFSRGAYTVRSLASVIDMCGIPSQNPDGSPLRYDDKSLNAVAHKAVTNVYQHISLKHEPARYPAYVQQRVALSNQFKNQHKSGNDSDPNTYPYFIGVFDTVAALGSNDSILTASVGVLLTLGLLTSFGLIFWPILLTLEKWALITGTLFLLVWYLRTHLKYTNILPKQKWFEKWHFNSWRHKTDDMSLNPKVYCARHALAIDERRKDFKNVGWGSRSAEPQRLPDAPPWLQQIWFAGNHADIGGGYSENESRLSDNSLHWMLEQAMNLPFPLLINPAALGTFPSPSGEQHDETRNWKFKYSGQIDRDIKPDAVTHSSVKVRFELKGVLQYDLNKPYRPEPLRNHNYFKTYYTGT